MKVLMPVLCFALAMAGLFWQYPWSVEYGMFRFGEVESLWAYVLTATAMTFVATGVRRLVVRIVPASRRVASIALGTGVTLLVLMLLAFIFGPLGANIPGTRVRGIFFAEWSFVLFILLSVPFAFLAMLLLSVPPRSGGPARTSASD